MQTRLQSLLETLLDIFAGFVISALFLKFVVDPLVLDCDITLAQSFSSGVLFTILAIVRRYISRRLGNRYLTKR